MEEHHRQRGSSSAFSTQVEEAAVRGLDLGFLRSCCARALGTWLENRAPTEHPHSSRAFSVDLINRTCQLLSRLPPSWRGESMSYLRILCLVA